MLKYGELKTQPEKVSAAKEMMSDYLEYKTRTGKFIEWLDKFSDFNLASYTKGMNVCDYVMKYQNSWGRIDEIPLETKRIDINNSGVDFDLITESEKPGYKTYSAINIKYQNGVVVKFAGSSSKKIDSPEGFQIFSFEGKTYLLLPRDDVSIIYNNKERLVCESEWSKTREETGGFLINSMRRYD